LRFLIENLNSQEEPVAGSDLQFVDRGVTELKGIPGEWRLFSVEHTPGVQTP
jgi:hypothetical protein